MKKFMILTLSILMLSAALTGCGCTANVAGTTDPTTAATTAPTTAPTTSPTTAPTTAPTTIPTTEPTVPSSTATNPTETEMPGIIDGTDGMDGTIAPDDGNGMDGAARHRSRGMLRK